MSHDSFSSRFKALSALFSRRITSNEPLPTIGEWIEPGGSLPSVDQAMNVYERAYIARLTESLGETFEATWMVLGDEGFFTVCEYYIRANGSNSYNLFDVCVGLPEFVKKVDLSNDFPFLYDLTRFELLFAKVFHQKRAPVPQIAMETTTLNENTKFIFCEGTQFFDSLYKIHPIWKMRKSKDHEGHELPIEVGSNPEQLTLFRGPDGLILIHSWDDWEFQALKQLHQSVGLGEALNSNHSEQNDEHLVQFFTRLFSSGLIIDVE